MEKQKRKNMETAKKYCEDGKFYYNLAKEYKSKPGLDIAIQYFHQVISIDFNCVEAHNYLSFCYGCLKDNTKSLEFAVKANEIKKC